jgi:hypothetical protein
LVGQQILVEQGVVYRFKHDMVRLVVSGDLSYWRRRLLDKRSAEGP